MLKIWVIIKTIIGIIIGYIHPIKKELKFINTKNHWDIVCLENKYEIDTMYIGKYKIPFDFAYDSIEIFRRKNIDCSCHRAMQIKSHTDGFEAYLIHYLHYPLDKKLTTITDKILNKLGILMAHVSCVYKRENKWYSFDWCNEELALSFIDACNKIADKYECDIKELVVQDINWKIVDYKKLS